jgi:hypothetical protein
MAVNIDTVYQRVLAITNKEQRGYVTPLEFNLLANQASLDIFEQYFYDKSQSERTQGNNSDFGDIGSILDEKISIFVQSTGVGGGQTLPGDLHRLGSVFVGAGLTGRREATYLDHKDWWHIQNTPLLQPTNLRPIYIRDGQSIFVFGTNNQQITANVNCNYVRQPLRVEWGYDVINEKALYNATTSVNFEHHRSEETRLVIKILELAGIIIQDPGVVQYADQEDVKKIQQEKA